MMPSGRAVGRVGELRIRPDKPGIVAHARIDGAIDDYLQTYRDQAARFRFGIDPLQLF